MVLFTASHGNIFVGGTCALPSDLLVLRSSGKSNGLPFASEAFLRRLGLVEELGTHKFAQILHTGNISSSLLMCSSHAG